LALSAAVFSVKGAKLQKALVLPRVILPMGMKREMRAVWTGNVDNIDYPAAKNPPAEQRGVYLFIEAQTDRNQRGLWHEQRSMLFMPVVKNLGLNG
jgi:hypothetical protein